MIKNRFKKHKKENCITQITLYRIQVLFNSKSYYSLEKELVYDATPQTSNKLHRFSIRLWTDSTCPDNPYVI